MRLLLLAPPGAGKGTQGADIQARLTERQLTGLPIAGIE